MSPTLHVYAARLCKRWWALMGCAGFGALAILAHARHWSNEWLSGLNIALAIFFFLVASYGAWKEQYDARTTAERQLHDGRPLFVLQAVGTQPLDSSNSDWRLLLTNCGGRTARYVRLKPLQSQLGAYDLFFNEIPALQVGETVTLQLGIDDRKHRKRATLWDFADDNPSGGGYFWHDISITYRDTDDLNRDGGIVKLCFDVTSKRLITGAN